MAQINTVQSISESRRAQFKQGAVGKKTGQTIIQSKSSQPGKIKKGNANSPTLQRKRLNIAAFQQQIQAALKSPPQRKIIADTTRSKIRARTNTITGPLSVNRTIKRNVKVNSLISRNRFSVKNTGNTQIRLRIKSSNRSSEINKIKIPDAPNSPLKTGRIDLLA